MKNRIIKFKAKRLDNGEWVEGDLIRKNNGVYIYNPQLINKRGYSIQSVKVDPSTVCQFTGLKDDNGKEIWERDILFRDGNPQIKEEVKFYKGGFCLDCMPLKCLIYYPFDVVQNFVSLGSKFDRKEGEK